MIRKPQQLAAALGCSFSDITLLEEALTHRSAGSRNNERLEFLGDAILGFVIAQRLYATNATATEGEMSRLRAALVRKGTLAAIARQWGLGDYLRLGSGELKSGGHNRSSILADALEAIIGAVYTDRGIAAAISLIDHLYGERLQGVGDLVAVKDPKSQLQEYLQSQGLPLPDYEICSAEGPAHARKFVVRCSVASCNVFAQGHGLSRRDAEQAAAVAVLEALKDA